MVFSSPVFLYLFLPFFLGVYHLVPVRMRLGWVLAGSWIFYGFWRPDFLGLMILVSVGNWLAGSAIGGTRFLASAGDTSSTPAGDTAPMPVRAASTSGRAILLLTVGLDLAVLGYFKYFNFGVESLNALLALWGGSPLHAWSVVLPVGISFYVFQAMSYVIDVYRGDADPAASFVDMAAYIALFPQLVAGPILRYKDIAFQLHRPDFDSDRIRYGVGRFIAGLCRKVLVADSVAPVANAVFALTDPTFVDAWLGVVAYGVQLYFDFSAYSDMAVGLGHMMGFTFMENFDAPYRSASITEFWRRWHISLSTWLRDYLYIPLGGNRAGPVRTYINLALVMVLGGLWHGASWNFVLWGAWQGLWLMLERFVGQRTLKMDRTVAQVHDGHRPGRSDDAMPGHRNIPPSVRLPGVARTLLLVAIGWVLFRSADLPAAVRLLSAMSGLTALSGSWAAGSAGVVWSAGSGISADMAWRFGGFELSVLAIALVIIIVEPRSGAREFQTRAHGTEGIGRVSALNGVGVAGAGAGPGYVRRVAGIGLQAAALIAVALKLSADSYSPFLYFQF